MSAYNTPYSSSKDQTLSPLSRTKRLCSYWSTEQGSGQDQSVQKCDTLGPPRGTIKDLALRKSPGALPKTIKGATLSQPCTEGGSAKGQRILWFWLEVSHF